MCEDIYIDVPSLQGLAERLGAAANRVTEITTSLNDTKAQLSQVWQDEGFEKYAADYAKGLENLGLLHTEICGMQKVLNRACEEYKSADEQILQML